MSYSVYLPDSFKRSLKPLTRRFPYDREDITRRELHALPVDIKWELASPQAPGG